MTDLTEEIVSYGRRLAGDRYAIHEPFITDAAHYRHWEWERSPHHGNRYAVTPYGYHISIYKSGDYDPESHATPNYWKITCGEHRRAGYSDNPLWQALCAMIEMQLKNPQPTFAEVREAAAWDRHVHARLPYPDD